MGSYTFTWEHPADNVYVTGTFDDWTKSVKLEKEGDIFSKTVELPATSKKIYYKFVVDHVWVINESAPHEPDHDRNVNNYLNPEDIKSEPAAAVISNVGPESTTAKLAGEQPKESKAAVTSEAKAKSVETSAADTKTPGDKDVPGGFPVTPVEEGDKTVSVNPLPAAPGGVNPVQLQAGEKVPESVTAQNVNQHVKLDKESYEKSDSLPVTSESKTGSENAFISTVSKDSTTATMAGEVPKESKAPADSDAPKGSENDANTEDEPKEESGGIVAAAAAAGGSVFAAAIAARDALLEKTAPAVDQATTAAKDAADKNLPESVKGQLPQPVQEAIVAHGQEQKREQISPEVPAEVKESIVEANKDPEAAASTDAVETKAALESELLKEVKPAPAIDDKAPAKVTEKTEKTTDAVTSTKPETQTTPKPVSKEEKQEVKKEEIKQDIKDKREEIKGEVKKAVTGSSTNGGAAKEGDSAAADGEKKKKKHHRISSFFQKIVHPEKK